MRIRQITSILIGSIDELCGLQVGMRNLRLGISLIGISIFSILILDFLPGPWVNEMPFADSTFVYVVMGLVFYVAIYFLGSPSLKYFGLPRWHFKTGVGLLVGSFFVISEITGSDNVHLGAIISIRGVIFLLAVGFGEEMVSRGLVYGALEKFGNPSAIFISSLLFGLMHLNLYTGGDWDPWEAYWHVTSAFAFGLLACALMIITRSIWVAVIFHALCDWSIVFDKTSANLPGRQDWGVGFWEGVTVPFSNVSLYIGCALVLLWIDRGGVPVWVYRLALKWKLVKPEVQYLAN